MYKIIFFMTLFKVVSVLMCIQIKDFIFDTSVPNGRIYSEQ